MKARKSIVLLCIALVVVAALLAVSIEIAAILTPLWLVVPAASIVSIRRSARCDEQLASLLALVPSRAPPA